MRADPVLVSWVAVNNDPFERDRVTQEPRLRNGERVQGPTLTLLFDPQSRYAGRVKDVVLFHRVLVGADRSRERRAVEELSAELEERGLRVHPEVWTGDDPTDHRGLFDYLRGRMPEIRERFPGQELVLHISPGTPSMHTIWVLMAETGYIDQPFTVVKSYRASDRRDRAAVVTVDVGIETFYKAYKASTPARATSEVGGLRWDPARFRGPVLRRLYAEARRFARLKVPLLLLGERGAGKTTLANWVRATSPYKNPDRNDAWPSVACGQYSSETMRAELFGYRRGAFTGADRNHEGLLAAAHGDTLFLDEVGDISRDMQRLLIRALEEKVYRPLGATKPSTSDFRLLTATNLDPQTLRERLDPDFFDRISALTLTVPPLREIPEELHWLWQAVYTDAVRRAAVEGPAARLGEDRHARIVRHLAQHPLPGNIRDLFRVSYRILAARCDPSDRLEPDDAVDYGLDALANGSPVNGSSLAQSAAAAFASGHPIDELVPIGTVLDTSRVVRDFKAYLATELRRIADIRGVKAGRLCDVSARALLNWTKQSAPPDARKESSEGQNISSGPADG